MESRTYRNKLPSYFVAAQRHSKALRQKALDSVQGNGLSPAGPQAKVTDEHDYFKNALLQEPLCLQREKTGEFRSLPGIMIITEI